MDEIEKQKQLSDSLKFMAAFFYEPDIVLFEEENVFQNLSALFESLCPGACTSVDNMHRAALNSSLEELNVAHAELFIGPYELKASPYGSTYLEKNRRIMGDSTIEVLKLYQKTGLEITIKQPPDHIAIELEFLAYVCGLESLTLQDGDLKKREELRALREFFLETYMLPWMPEFISNIRSGTETEFYLHLADCFEMFMQCLAVYNKSSADSQSGRQKAHVHTTASRENIF